MSASAPQTEVVDPLGLPAVAAVPERTPTVEQAGEIRSSRIESLRALAALAVVASHTYSMPRGFAPASDAAQRLGAAAGYGVYVFFALSGYLLFKPFAERMLAGARPIDHRRYAINRAVRILPLYYVVLATVLIVEYHGGTFVQWWRFSLFVQNFWPSTVQTVDGPMWSLVIELHFYLILPLLALAIGRLARGSALRAGGMLLLLAAASVLVHHYGDSYPLRSRRVWDSILPATFFFFVPGMILAILKARLGAHTLASHRLASANLWLIAGLALWAYVLGSFTLKGEVAVALGSFLVLGACVLPLRPARALRALDWRPLAVLGVASYSLYLWHVPLLTWLLNRNREWFGSLPSTWILFLEAAALCLPAALASYALIEWPFLRLRRRWFAPSPS